MDDQLDKDLKKRIKEVFDNFEDASAGEGWLQLRKKFPEKQANRLAFAWIWWGAAAILFLFLGIGVWMYSANNSAEKYSIKTRKGTQSENLAGNKSHKVMVIKTVPQHKEIPAKAASGSIAAASPGKVKTLAPPANGMQSAINSSIINNAVRQKIYAENTNNGHGQIIAQASGQNLVGGMKDKCTDSAKNVVDQQKIATTATVNNPTANQQKSPVADKPKPVVKSMASMFAETQDVKDKKVDKKSKRVDFGVYAATYFNYAKGSNNQANIGAGITSDIKITENLKLVTGITIAQNSLNFTGGVPTTTAQSNLPFYPASNAQGALVVASAYNIKSAVTDAAVPAFKNYDASLVGLDIPVDLKYVFSPAKNNVYVLAGFSSGTFINETYTYQYNYPALFSPSLQQIQDETSRKSFNNFYFAKILNLAFGVGYPLGKNSITLEPFLRYPLDGLGSQNIRFGAGGINLKFNFQSQKK